MICVCKVFRYTAKELDEACTIADVSCVRLYYYGARYLDAKYSRWLSADPAVGEYLDQSSKGEDGAFNVLNLNLYHYGNNNPVKYTDPDGESVFGAAIIGGLISAGIDYAFQVGGNYLQGKRGAELWTDINVGQLAGSFVSGALTTVGLGSVSNVASLANKGGKLIQLAGSAVVSAGASVPGTIAQNFVNNKINPDNKVDLFDGVVDNMKSSAKAGVVSAVLTPLPKVSARAPDFIKNRPNYVMKGDRAIRKGALPCTTQATWVQVAKDVGSEIVGQGFNKIADSFSNKIKKYYKWLCGNKDE